MKLTCSECRQQLGELMDGELMDGELSGDATAGAEIRAHLADCEQCRRELALMQKARDEMRAFPILAAPADLRGRVRAQLEAAQSTPAASAAPSRTHVVAATQISSEETKVGLWNRLARFFQNPQNLAWSSSLVLSVFCIMLLARPDRQIQIVSAPYEVATNADSAADKTKSVAGAKRGATPKPLAKKPATANAPAAPLPFPGNPFPPFMAPIPEVAPSDPSDFGFTTPSTGGQSPAVATLAPKTKPTPSAASVNTNGVSTQSTPPAPKAINPRGGGALESSVKTKVPNSGPTTSFSTEKIPPPSVPRDGEKDIVRPPSAPVSNGASDANFGQLPKMNADSASPQISGSSVAREADSMTADNTNGRAIFSAPKAKPAVNPTMTRQVVARIKAPRDFGWGQLSVVLPDGARFSDNTKARVLWRGSAEAGETIEVRFKVQAAPGAHEIRVSLQEIKNGQAQTLATDSVSVSGR